MLKYILLYYQFSEWGYVGYGTSSNLNIDVKAKEEGEANKIIVSRSHQGDVEKVAKEAFGENTEVIPAGGAGNDATNIYFLDVVNVSV